MANADEIRPKDVTPTIDAFRTGDKMLIDGPSGSANMSKDTLLELTAQNALAGNVAPAFIPNSTTTIAGWTYVYNGLLYVAKETYQGPWDASKFETVILSSDIISKKTEKVLLENLMANAYSTNYVIPQPASVFTKTSYTDSSVLCTITDNSGNSRLNCTNRFNGKFVSGHIYYSCCDVKPSIVSYAKVYLGDGYCDTEVFDKNVWSRISGRRQVYANNEIGIYCIGVNLSIPDETIEFKNFAVIDLTATFGVGREPSKELMDYLLWGKAITPGQTLEVERLEDIYNKGAVTFCGSNSDLNYGEIPCNGFADDVKINNYFSSHSPSKVVFKGGSNFLVSAPIKVASGQHIIGYDAKITMTAVAEFMFSTLGRASNGIDWILRFTKTSERVDAVSHCYDGVYLEMYRNDATAADGTSHVVAVVKNSNEAVGQFRLYDHEGVSSWVGGGAGQQQARTVSSVFDATSVSNVIFEGIECDLNVLNNPQCFSTFDCQNGATVYLSNNIRFKDCYFHDGGRHGILLSSSTYGIVDSCTLDNWGEHGIDLASHTFSYEPPESHHVVTNSICRNNGGCGIQLHRGSNCIVKGNFTSGNGAFGISMMEYAHDNIAEGNVSEGDDRGFQVYKKCYRCVIANNKVLNAEKDGISIEDSNNAFVEGNVLNGCKWNGIRVTVNSDIVDVHGNTVTDSRAHTSGLREGDIQVNNSTHVTVMNNTSRTTLYVDMAGITETGTSDNNVFLANTVYGWGDAVLIGGSNSVSQANVHIS